MQPLWPKKNTVKFGLCTTFRYAEKDQWIQVALPGHLLSANRLPFLPETNTERSERRATELPIFQFYESYSCHQLARSSGLCFAQICVYSMTCDSHQIHRIKTWQVAMLRIPWKHTHWSSLISVWESNTMHFLLHSCSATFYIQDTTAKDSQIFSNHYASGSQSEWVVVLQNNSNIQLRKVKCRKSTQTESHWKSLPQGPGCLCNWGALALLGFPRLLGIMASGPGWMP